jgi:hypothetical protein
VNKTLLSVSCNNVDRKLRRVRDRNEGKDKEGSEETKEVR